MTREALFRESARRGRQAGDTPERGAVLVLAVLAMMATVLLGVAFAEAVANRSVATDADFSRGGALALAEAALELAYEDQLYSSIPTGSQGPLPFGGGQITIAVQTVGANTQVVTTGEFGGQVAHYISQARVVDSAIAIDSPFLAGDTVSTRQSTLKWGGEMRTVQPFSPDKKSTVTGTDVTVSAFTPIALSTADFAATSDVVLPDGTALSSPTLSGRIYCPGSVTISGTAKIQGTLVAAGNISFSGAGGSLTIEATGATALLAGDLLTLTDYSSVDVRGACFARNGLNIASVTSFRLLGSLVCNQVIAVNDSGLTAEYDPALRTAPPAELTGGPRRRLLTELWRVPYTGPQPAIGGTRPAPPADDNVTLTDAGPVQILLAR